MIYLNTVCFYPYFYLQKTNRKRTKIFLHEKREPPVVGGSRLVIVTL